MPQGWFTTWPLSDGSCVSQEFAAESKQKQIMGLHIDDRGKEAARRQIFIDTFGNLTLLTSSLNSSISNGPFEGKRGAIVDQSALRLNRYFADVHEWSETAIMKRGELLLADGFSVWPRPGRDGHA